MMGVWCTGPRARQAVLHEPSLRAAYDRSLPGWTEADVDASPYAVADFTVAAAYGGGAGLAALRARLAARGIKLILDFVPNHLGLDHPWLAARPELFVGAATRFAGAFAHGGRFVAYGKDPYFEPWIDTVQLDYRNPDTRAVMTDALLQIASRCDGVRCDMAMLVLPDVFARTWSHVPSEYPDRWDFWSQAIAAVRRAHPSFVFLAEAYWSLEDRLCELGFDYAYDKHLYDLIAHDRGAEIGAHVRGTDSMRRAHFIENHDEPRAAAALDPARLRAALVLVLGLPGMRFLHDGQLTGRRRFSRIQLVRRPLDDADPAVAALYAEVLRAFASSLVGRGTGRVLEPHRAWDDNPTASYFTIVQWSDGDRFDLVIANLAPHRAQCRVMPSVPGLAGRTWQLVDRLGDERWLRDGDELATRGLFLDLPARGAQLFSCTWR